MNALIFEGECVNGFRFFAERIPGMLPRDLQTRFASRKRKVSTIRMQMGHV